MITPDWPLYARRGVEMARLMRWVICAVVVLVFAPGANAEDFAVLRGSQPTYSWAGFYGGAQGGESSATVNFNQTTAPAIANILRNTAIESDENISGWSVLSGENTAHNQSYGAFVGYNVEWENVILGMEVNYNRVSLNASTANGIERFFTDSADLPPDHNYLYDMHLSASASMHITDILTFRGRAGWEAGNFLPYAFAGLAIGRADVSSLTTLYYTATDYPTPQNPPITPLSPLAVGPDSLGTTEGGAFAYGFATGLGIDIALFPHVFVRGEGEYIYFAPLDHIQASVASARLGVGYKF
jgi:outer membrane immunogenic protein